ncbi:MAG: archaemetzincin family Zn-dependent metalloprotease [Candidatus Saccharicenans sp.]|nr:archaemetzincin family Zn-dependent metalloprotease [Candidatus Saccharicenans sp.]
MERKSVRIILLPVGTIEEFILDTLSKATSRIFNCQVSIYEKIKVPDEAYNPARNQYSSSKILEKMRSFIKLENGEKALGVADVDLYVPGLNFVFGEAELGGRLAIISLTRLRQSFYGLPDDRSLFLQRAVKEAVHELGHLYGRGHCPDFRCIMHFSNSLLDTDRKSVSFCPRCRLPEWTSPV